MHSYKEATTESFWRRTFYGGAFTQIIRTVAYGVSFLILLIAAIAVVIKLSDTRAKSRRKKLVKSFKQKSDVERDEENLLQVYVAEGGTTLFNIESYMRSHFGEEHAALYRSVFPHLEKRLLAIGLIQETENGNVANAKLNRTFEDFMKFLRANGIFEMLDARPQMSIHMGPP